MDMTGLCLSITRTRPIALLAVLTCLGNASDLLGQGIYISTAGPVNRGMGGAATAAPVDALGAIYWNPATISGLKSNEMEFGLDLMWANHSVSSSILGVGGTTNSEPGVVPVPNVGWVYHTKNPAVTLGLGINTVAGLKTNLLSGLTNPILAPQPLGFGRVSSEALFLQLAPVISVALSDSLSVAAGPTITTAQLGLEPFVFDAPNANGTYPSGKSSRYHWGGGAQAGVYYIHNCDWHLGASIKTPTWMETFEFFAQDGIGTPRIVQTDVDLPLIASLGLAYSGRENLLVALDVRYFDYANTDGFGDPAEFGANGALRGLDWSSVFALALGIQQQVGEKLQARMGYTYNQNPIKNSESFFNTGSPLIYQHMLSAGATYNLTPHMSINLAYSHMFHNRRTGPIVLPGIGQVPFSSVSNEVDVHWLSFGIVMRN